MDSSWGSDVGLTGLGLRWPCGKVNNVSLDRKQTAVDRVASVVKRTHCCFVWIQHTDGLLFKVISKCINTHGHITHFFPSSRKLFAYTTRKQFPLCATPTCASLVFYYLLKKMREPGLKSCCWRDMWGAVCFWCLAESHGGTSFKI